MEENQSLEDKYVIASSKLIESHVALILIMMDRFKEGEQDDESTDTEM